MSQSTPFFGNIDLRDNEIVKAVFENRTSHPSNTKGGKIYYNTTDNAAYCYIGNEWVDITKIYKHPKYQALNPEITGAHVLAKLVINDEGHVLETETRILSLSDLGFEGDLNANNYTHPTYNISGTGELSGARVISNMTINTEGHVTEISTRNITAADIGAAAINDNITSLTATWSSQKIQTSLVQIGNRFDGVLKLMGTYIIPTNTPNITSPNTKKGHCYIVTGGDGIFKGTNVGNGSMLIANVDNPQTFSDWFVIGNGGNMNIEYATNEVYGIVRFATDQEIIDGEAIDAAVKPHQLNTWFENSELNDYVDPFETYITARDLLPPTFLTFNVTPQSESVEVGTTLEGMRTFSWGIVPNGGIVGSVGIYDQTAATPLVIETDNDGEHDTEITTIKLNTEYQEQSWFGVSNNIEQETTNSDTFTVTAYFQRFFGSVSTLPLDNADGTSNRIYANNLTKEFHTSGSNTFTLVTGTAERTFVVLLPPNKIITSVFDETNGNTDITTDYVMSSITIKDNGGTDRLYNMYTSSLGAPYSISANHVIKTS